jgi:very-short-patch-repair endonuclease
MFCIEVTVTLAARQHGSVTVAQLYDLGATESTIRHMVRSGQWIRVSSLVLRRAGSPRTRAQELTEAVLDAGDGAALSHLPAAAWWGLNVRPGGIEVTRRRGTTTLTPRLGRVHEPRMFPPHHRTVHRGVPVVVPSRLPFEVAATVPAMTERVLDRAWARGLLSHLSMAAMLDDLAERGRPGIRLVRELLAERGPGYRPNDTNLEDRFQELAREVGLLLIRQRQLLDREWLGRVDFLSLERALVIEVLSALYHDALVDRAADFARREALEAAGFRVEEVWDHEVWHNPAGTLRRLRDIARETRTRTPTALP